MTYYGGKEMAASFRTVRENTIKIAEEIPEDKYGFKPANETRTIGKTLAHIALGTGFQHHIHGNKISDMRTVNFGELMQKAIAEEAKPRTKAETIAFLRS
ncbi:MAG: DinB family protein, partial [Vicinamibacterales bacterium]